MNLIFGLHAILGLGMSTEDPKPERLYHPRIDSLIYHHAYA